MVDIKEYKIRLSSYILFSFLLKLELRVFISNLL